MDVNNATNRKYCTQDFVFSKVITRPYYTIYLIAIIAAVVAGLFFIGVIRPLFFRGGLPLSVCMMILVMMLIIKTQTKTVMIYFDRKSMFIGKTDGGFERLLQKNITGIYMHNYATGKVSQVFLTILLTNNRKIHLTDANLFVKDDKEKQQMLKQFFNAATKRLNLQFVKKNKWRSLQGIGANLYTPINMVQHYKTDEF